MRSYTRRAGSDIADGYYRPRTIRAGSAASGLGSWYGGRYRQGAMGAYMNGPIQSPAGPGTTPATYGFPQVPYAGGDGPIQSDAGPGLQSATASFSPRPYTGGPVQSGAAGTGIQSGAAGTGIQSVTAASPNGGTVVTTTSAGGTTDTTAPAVTPPSVLKQKIGSAKGAHGFLVWATSALPAPVAKAILAAAIARSISYRQGGGQLGVFGDTSDDSTMAVDPSIMSPDLSSITPDASAFDVGSIDLSSVASDAAPSSSWTSAIGQTATQATASAGLSATLANAVNSLVSTNLQRASAGQAPLPVAAGAGIGATAAGSGKTLLWGGAVVGVILLLMVMSKGK
jgi:hypothetical protein